MKKLNLYIRRIHLYLSLTLIPWFLMYAVSSIVFSHTQYFDSLYGGWQPKWSVRFDKELQVEIPENADLRVLGHEIIEKSGLPKLSFGIYKNNDEQLNIYMYSFMKSIKVTYFIQQNRLLAEDAGFRWDHFLTSMHARGGFQQESILSDLWAVIVDLFCVAMLIWIITGIYMWWMIKSVRWWGAFAIVGGIVSFTVFVLLL